MSDRITTPPEWEHEHPGPVSETPREWWIDAEPKLNLGKFDFRGDYHDACTVKRNPRDIHVIERCAYDALMAEAVKLRAALEECKKYCYKEFDDCGWSTGNDHYPALLPSLAFDQWLKASGGEGDRRE